MFFSYDSANKLQWNLNTKNHNASKHFDLSTILNQEHIQTPCYIYSQEILEGHYLALDALLSSYFKKHEYLICFSIKSCSNINIAKLLKNLGSGADVVSGGEILRAKEAGINPNNIVFAGVGKTRAEIELAIETNILQLNAESFEELEFINEIANQKNKIARVCVRMNPDIDAKTHKHITTGKKDNKFGIAYSEIIDGLDVRLKKFTNLQLNGFSTHIGSQITEIEPLEDVFTKLVNLHNHFVDLGYNLSTIDFGGGLGVKYQDEFVLPPEEYASVIFKASEKLKSKVKVIIEPGRFIAARAGILLSKVLYVKKAGGKLFAILDAGMNDLIRPALYEAKHSIFNLKNSNHQHKYDIVGPVCESACAFAKNLELPEVKQGDTLLISNAGAYGSVMSSRYNTRPLIGEYLITKDQKLITIRRPETYNQIFENELN